MKCESLTLHRSNMNWSVRINRFPVGGIQVDIFPINIVSNEAIDQFKILWKKINIHLFQVEPNLKSNPNFTNFILYLCWLVDKTTILILLLSKIFIINMDCGSGRMMRYIWAICISSCRKSFWFDWTFNAEIAT